jgi:hypothetical protein
LTKRTSALASELEKPGIQAGAIYFEAERE